MRFVKALNEVSSQVWAILLVALGVGSFCLAAHFSEQDVRSALMTSATGMIGGGIAMFQHQPKDQETTTSTQTVPQSATQEK